MPSCPTCGEATARKRRNPVQKLFTRAVYKCQDCGTTRSIARAPFRIFNRYAECPRCGTQSLSKRTTRDRIDSMTTNPLRRALLLLGCPLYHCTFCRLQFRDWRPRHPSRVASAKSSAA